MSRNKVLCQCTAELEPSFLLPNAQLVPWPRVSTYKLPGSEGLIQAHLLLLQLCLT